MAGSWSGARQSYPKRTRQAILNRYPGCQCGGCAACTPTGCARPSTIADHRIPYATLVRLGLDPDDEDNGQGMCGPCHDIKTTAEKVAGKARMRGTRTPPRHPSEGVAEGPSPRVADLT